MSHTDYKLIFIAKRFGNLQKNKGKINEERKRKWKFFLSPTPPPFLLANIFGREILISG